VISYLRTRIPYAVAWHRVLKYLPEAGYSRKIIQKILTDKGIDVDTFEKSKFGIA
jgi:hypothetical protein